MKGLQLLADALRRSNLRRFYLTIDLRSLGLFRILLGAIWIADWFTRWPHLEAFYTARGTLPNFAPLSPTSSEFHFSLLTGATTLPIVQVVFLLGLACYVGFLLGIHTRVFHIASVVFFGSVLARNEIISHGGDSVMLAMGFWTAFLPLGKRFSIDALRDAAAAPAGTLDAAARCAPSLAAFVAVAQLGLIYSLSASVKQTGELWVNGTALYYALNLDNFALPLGRWFAAAPLPVIEFLTYSTLYLEWAGLPLIMLPWPQPLLRRALVIGLGIMHLGTAFLLELSTFPYTMIASYALLLDASDWNLLDRAARPILARLGGLQPRLDAMQRGLLAWFGPSGRVELDARQLHLARWRQRVRSTLAQTAVGIVFACVLLNGHNLSWARPRERALIPQPRWMRGTLESLQMVHAWYMFAPNPMTTDGWWVIDGITESNSKIDPFTQQPPTWAKPADLHKRWNVFWQLYLVKLSQGEYHKYRGYLGRYLTMVDQRTRPRGQKLVRFDFYYVTEPTPPPGTPKPFPAQPVYLWSFNCATGAVETSGPQAH